MNQKKKKETYIIKQMLHFFVSHFFFSLDFFRMIILFSLICINYSITKNCLIDCNNNFSKVDQKKKGNFLVLNNFYYFLNFFFLKKNKITLCLIKFLFLLDDDDDDYYFDTPSTPTCNMMQENYLKSRGIDKKKISR